MEVNKLCQFESSVNSYDSQTICEKLALSLEFESSVNSYDSQTHLARLILPFSLRVV